MFSMKLLLYISLAEILTLIFARCDKEVMNKKVLVVLLARNKEHILPYFFQYFERLNYPKSHLALYIRSDHNNDKTNKLLESWLLKHGEKYHSVDKILRNDTADYVDSENKPWEWSYDRMKQVILHKEEALVSARDRRLDFIWFLDMDVFLRDSYVLKKLIKEDKTIVAPKLNSISMYSSFWGAMTESYWYKSSDYYEDIYSRYTKGCFSVPLVLGCILVNLSKENTEYLSFLKENIPSDNSKFIPFDDLIIFSLSATRHGIEMYVCNKEEEYGNMLLPQSENYVKQETEQLKLLFVDILGRDVSCKKLPEIMNVLTLKRYVSRMKNLMVDKIYCINLKRRPERRRFMEKQFQYLGLKADFVEAFDWKLLNSSFLTQLKARKLKGCNRSAFSLTYGYVANFLSHHNIWKYIIENNIEQAIIFEDDAQLHDDFVEKMEELSKELKMLNIDWDFIYLGRKKKEALEETWVEGSQMLLNPRYSLWAGAYIITYEGAKKLIAANPFTKLTPSDIYFCIMADIVSFECKHRFPTRNLKAFAVEPFFAFTFDTGREPSDTIPSITKFEHEVVEIDINGQIISES